MIGKIQHIMFWSNDLEKTKVWYKEKLGFRPTYHAPGEFLAMSSDSMGGLTFHQTKDKDCIGTGPLPYFGVKDLQQTVTWLEQKGVKVKPIQQVSDSPLHTWFWDGDGNVLGLQESTNF
jgi:catechol 2,3-dioxygenase-like lactoylglutathione lyase family enzyme